MPKYTSMIFKKVPPPPLRPHPIWRGIGCLMMLIVPLLSLALAQLLVPRAIEKGWPIPYQLLGPPVLPPLLWKLTFLSSLWLFLQRQDNFYAVLSLTLILIVVLGAAFSVAYAFLYKVIGPPTYGPLDVPPLPIKTRRYKR